MPAHLITSTAEPRWTVDVVALDAWLCDRWSGVVREGDGTGQLAHLWTLPDRSDVSVPERLDAVWVGAPPKTLAAIGVWCASTTRNRLILSDEGYTNPIELTGLNEGAVVAALGRG